MLEIQLYGVILKLDIKIIFNTASISKDVPR